MKGCYHNEKAVTDGQTDRRTDGRTDGRTERQTDGKTDRGTQTLIESHCGHWKVVFISAKQPRVLSSLSFADGI